MSRGHGADKPPIATHTCYNNYSQHAPDARAVVVLEHGAGPNKINNLKVERPSFLRGGFATEFASRACVTGHKFASCKKHCRCDSSVGGASDPRPEGPRFDPGLGISRVVLIFHLIVQKNKSGSTQTSSQARRKTEEIRCIRCGMAASDGMCD